MAFTIPDAANAGNVAQAGWDSIDIDALVSADAGNFVESGCAVAQRGAGANMSVDVALGVIRNSGTTTKISVSATNKVITTADATNGRIDIVTASSAGALTVTAGTPAAAADATNNGPICPAIPAGDVLLAAVYVGAGVTSVVTANIIDKRVSGRPVDCQIFTSNGTWTKPANATTVQVICIGGGGGGGSGAHITSGTASSGGAGGGGGTMSQHTFPASTLGSTETVTVAAVATGGAAKVAGDGSIAGAAGTNGNVTSFGTTVRIQSSNTGAVLGGQGGKSAASSTGGLSGVGLFAGSGVAGATGTSGTIGAAAGSGSNAGFSGATGGGSAGGLAATPAALAGGAGGAGHQGWGTPVGGTAGSVGNDGGVGTSPTVNMPVPGTGGGGGASAASGTAHDGGNGGTYGGGGGGGGSAISTGQSGKGGDGAAGICVVYSW